MDLIRMAQREARRAAKRRNCPALKETGDHYWEETEPVILGRDAPRMAIACCICGAIRVLDKPPSERREEAPGDVYPRRYS